MSELVCLTFQERFKADALRAAIRELQDETAIELRDLAVISKDVNDEIHIEQDCDMYTQLCVAGALYFGFLCAVLGWVFALSKTGIALGIQVGLVFGWFAGAVTAWALPICIPSKLIKEAGNRLTPGTSAVVILSKTELITDKVLAKLKGLDGYLAETDLGAEQARKLAMALKAS
jgi:uncharacterized membrane protein